MPSLTYPELVQYIQDAKEKMVTEPFEFTRFIETGTYFGDTIENMKEYFSKIYTIEVSQMYNEKAKERFKDYPHIHCIHGDSGLRLKEIVPQEDEHTVFWLDGHWSMGNTEFQDVHVPLYKELDSILQLQKVALVIVDDVRLFGKKDYDVDWQPITIDQVLEKVQPKLLAHWFAPSSLYEKDRLILLLK